MFDILLFVWYDMNKYKKKLTEIILVIDLLTSICLTYKYKKNRPQNYQFWSLLEGGGFLLSRFRSTIGVIRFNFSVRNGKRWSPYAITALALSKFFSHLLHFTKKRKHKIWPTWKRKKSLKTDKTPSCR